MQPNISTRIFRTSVVALLLQAMLFSATAILPTALVPSSAEAQLRIVDPDASGRLETTIERGLRLERDKKWAEALAHYEDAIKELPSSARLKQRYETARIHYDLTRRYNDISFGKSLRTMSLAEALDLYDEVLLKVDSHYVQTKNWQELVARGTTAVELALRDENFVRHNLQNVDSQRIEAVRQRLRTVMQTQRAETRYEARNSVSVAAQTVSRYLPVKQSAVALEYLCAAVGGLDPYSTYLTGDQLRDVYAQIDGNFVGLGIELKAEGGALSIVGVIKGSPAYRAGIKSGDRITAIGGRTTLDLNTSQAAAMLQGSAGSTVSLSVVTGNAAARTLNIRREHVEVPSITDVKLVDEANRVGYLKLDTFQRSTSRDMDAALWKLHNQGMRSLIIDVRGNPGGLLSSAVDVADKFVSRGTIVSTRGRNKSEDYDYGARPSTTWRVPLVVLIDDQSASASEIFAGAIRDHRRGTIVGVRSYGKGSVQGIFPLARIGAGVRLTTAKFYSPSGRPISNVGVTPDIVVHTAAKLAEQSELAVANDDQILRAGVQAARRQLAQR